MVEAPATSKTPVLDLESPLPSTRLGFWLRCRRALLQFLLILLSFPFIVLFVLGLIKLFGQSGIEVPVYLFLPFLVIAALPMIAIHELGHVIAGFIVGLRFKRVIIGPLQITTPTRGLKFSFYSDFGLDGLTGMALHRFGKLRSKLAIYVAGGPIANVVSGLIGGAAVRYGIARSAFVVQAIEIFVGASILIGLVNLAPFRLRSGVASDGVKLLWLTSKEKTRRWICMLALQTQQTAAARPKDLKSTWISSACAVHDNSPTELSTLWTAYVAAQDCGRADLAAARLESCLQLFAIAPPQFRGLLLTEAAIFQAWCQRSADKANAWCAKANEIGGVDLLNAIRLEISMNWVRQSYDAALSAWQKGLDRIESLPASGARDLAKQGWLEWKDEMDKRCEGREKPALNDLAK